MLFDTSLKPIVDFIGKVENINNDFNTIVKKIGLEDIKLLYVNKSNVNNIDYKNWLNKESIELINKFFDFELEYFKYRY